MIERPILFNDAMVRAILSGAKTQTRRIVKLPDDATQVRYWAPPSGRSQPGWADPGVNWWNDNGNHIDPCPYGQPGDRLWVRECWSQPTNLDPGPTFYRADYPECVPPEYENVPSVDQVRWKPSIHMPRAACRIVLEIVSVRVERLQNISEADAKAEGAKPYLLPVNPAREELRYVEGFLSLWQSINGSDSWEANPWVWVIEFKRVTP